MTREWEAVPLYGIAKQKQITNCIGRELLSVYLGKGVVPFSSQTAKRTNVTSTDLSKYQAVDCGDFVLNNQQAWRGSVGVSRYCGIISPAYIVLALNDDISSEFADYLFQSRPMVDKYVVCSKGVGTIQRNIYWDFLKRISVPLPPRAEQDQIVRYIDWKVSGINRLVHAKKKQIALLQEQKRAVINEAVTRGDDGWKMTALKRLLATPMSDGPHETPEFIDEGVPFVSAEAAHDGRIFLSDCRGYISREQHEIYCKKVKPQRNDIYIVKSGSTTGKVVMVDIDDEFSIWSPLALVRCKPEYNCRYIFYFLGSSQFQKSVQDNWSFGTQPNIGMGVLQNLPVSYPTLQEQLSIVEYLDNQSAKFYALTTKINTEIILLHEYRTRLISDVVTGKLDVRDVVVPKYEVVEETANAIEDDLEETEGGEE